MFLPHGRYGTFDTLKRCAWTVRVFWSPGQWILRCFFFVFLETLKKHCFWLISVGLIRSNKLSVRWRRCLRRVVFLKNDIFLKISSPSVGGAASGGSFFWKWTFFWKIDSPTYFGKLLLQENDQVLVKLFRQQYKPVVSHGAPLPPPPPPRRPRGPGPGGNKVTRIIRIIRIIG